jgi:uncharacterized UPF0146 family protein
VAHASEAALADALSGFDRLVEVGVGRRPAVAARLAAAGKEVVATDVHPQEVPDGVRFVRDDVTDPDVAVYEGADAVYALNCPPELHRPTLSVARTVDAAFLFTTLGGDPPAVEVTPTTLPDATLYRAR